MQEAKMLLSKETVLHLLLFFLGTCSVEGQMTNFDTEQKFVPESNILSAENRDTFDFKAYPNPDPRWGKGSNVADERQWLYGMSWNVYGVQVKADGEDIAYLQVNLKKPYYVRAFAVTGYALGSHRPKGSFFLEGSSDEVNWKMVAEGQASQWRAPGTYPFHPSQIIKALYPNKYQYYRVIAKGWTNGYMVIYNWGLFS